MIRSETIMFFVLALFLTAMDLGAQNQVDEMGRKTEPWKVEYPNGKTLYEGTFREGLPVGELIRYYDTGAVRARMSFDDSGTTSFARLFYKGGKKAAEGIFHGQEKDSVWNYYSEFDASLRMKESFQMGLLNGPSYRYYPSGEVSEVTNWVNDSMQGPWIQYYEDGTLRLEGHYHKDELHGIYEVFGPGEKPVMKGQYEKGLSTGIWDYYQEDGEIMYSLEYRDGMPVDQELFMKIMLDSVFGADTLLQEAQPFQPF
jgi:antitoxin component YwqK of YwqJK toxin-antitoxin module